MSNSSLVQYILKSPNHSGKRTSKIKGVVLHHVAGVVSVETLGRIFLPRTRQASSNYGVGYDGRIALYVDEENQAWTTSNRRVDNQMVTIEASNSSVGGQWLVSDLVLNRVIDLIVDIFKRNGIAKAIYTGNEQGNLWLHKWYANTLCPGPYLISKMNYIALEINKRLGLNSLNPISVGAKVRIKADAKNYANTPKPVAIPSSIKGNYYTIQQLTDEKALLQEIVSWVYIKDLIEYQTPNSLAKELKVELVKDKKEQVPITTYKTVIKKPFIRLRKDTSLWAFDKTNWSDIKKVKDFKKDSELQVKAIITNKLGGKYYVTPYSYDNKIMNGINFVDADLFYK